VNSQGSKSADVFNSMDGRERENYVVDASRHWMSTIVIKRRMRDDPIEFSVTFTFPRPTSLLRTRWFLHLAYTFTSSRADCLLHLSHLFYLHEQGHSHPRHILQSSHFSHSVACSWNALQHHWCNSW
jgi:hypothetical protein